MQYIDLYKNLRNQITAQPAEILPNPHVRVHNIDFHSAHAHILPGIPVHHCQPHNLTVKDEANSATRCYPIREETLLAESDDIAFGRSHCTESAALFLRGHDAYIEENQQFRIHIFTPATRQKTPTNGDPADGGTVESNPAEGGPAESNTAEAILLFHGFNEKSWQKYYPWAQALVNQTGMAVILFPMAFHMNRAPLAWSDRRLMFDESEKRVAQCPGIYASSFVNAAISIRLHTNPQRFLWSGLQSYHDVVQFIGNTRQGLYPMLGTDTRFHLFAYSIGGLLAQTLLMTNPGGHFTTSKLCLFCSGAAFSRMTPINKAIMDSETEQALYRYILRYLEQHLAQDPWLRHFLQEPELHPEGYNFLSLLNYNKMCQERETAFHQLAGRIYAIALENDSVIPYYEVTSTLQGRKRDIPIRVDIDHFPYPYKHEEPFPAREAIASQVDEAFRNTFAKFAAFYKA